MNTTMRKIASLTTVLLVLALVATVSTKALANPRFGSDEFRVQLKVDSGLFGSRHSKMGPCPTIRGVPLPSTWGRKWRLNDEWVRYVARHGHPKGHGWVSERMPNRKWQNIVNRYKWYVQTHRFDAREYQQVLEYLEQDWYNYWYRQRYGENPPNHRSHSHGFRADGVRIIRGGQDW
ncbi:MAG: hypothetical protein J7M38_06140 [Armatimonadetes bacterium]|nr:hypothetical protein [Armatimonadota bacterium]